MKTTEASLFITAARESSGSERGEMGYSVLSLSPVLLGSQVPPVREQRKSKLLGSHHISPTPRQSEL